MLIGEVIEEVTLGVCSIEGVKACWPRDLVVTQELIEGAVCVHVLVGQVVSLLLVRTALLEGGLQAVFGSGSLGPHGYD